MKQGAAGAGDGAAVVDPGDRIGLGPVLGFQPAEPAIVEENRNGVDAHGGRHAHHPVETVEKAVAVMLPDKVMQV